MPTRRFRKDIKGKTRKNRKITKGQKGHKGKRVWMYRKGNVVLCYRIPYLHVRTVGGAADVAPSSKEKAEVILDQIRNVLEVPEKTYLVNNKEKLVEILVNDPTKKELIEKTGDILNEKNKEQKEELIKWIIQRKYAYQIIEYVRQQAQEKQQKFSPEELTQIEKLLNHEPLKEVKGTLSSISSGVFNGVSNGAVSLGKFLTPPPVIDSENTLQNETTVEFLWYPRSNINYRKGKSVVTPKTKYGDFMIYIEPERYADMTTYFSSMANSVEDLFADALNGCSDSFCLKGKVPRMPYKKQLMTVINKQPQFDLKESQTTELEPESKAQAIS